MDGQGKASEAAGTDADEAEILFDERGVVGLVTLNRPKALNALTLGMVRALTPKLAEWAANSSIKLVAIQGAGGKAFCAGGDIRKLYDVCKEGRFEDALSFWREEYQLNRIIKRYPKPYVSLIDGIVMGGGVGLSAHGAYRVASDKYLFAMPEVGIGFFPDVGATYVLPRLPAATGIYLALTGARIKAGDALAIGLATHAVPSERFAEVLGKLADGEPIDQTLRKFMAPAAEAPLDRQRALIHDVFSRPDLASVLGALDRLEKAGSSFAAETLRTIRSKSPTSLAIAFEQMRRGASLSFEDAMALEYRIVSRIGEGVDFYEGVRAVIVDKDQKPIWSPASIEALSPTAVEAYFAPLQGDELTFADA